MSFCPFLPFISQVQYYPFLCSFKPLEAYHFLSVNHWFYKRRGLALGIVTSGSSVGGVVWPIMINNLIIKVGHNLVPKFRRIFLIQTFRLDLDGRFGSVGLPLLL
jgi:hypothetical protein